MALRPTYSPPLWATNAAFAAGAAVWSSQPNKAVPSAGVIAEGFDPAAGVPAEWVNYLFNAGGGYLNYLSDDLMFRETWSSPVGVSITAQGKYDEHWVVYSTVATNLLVKSPGVSTGAKYPNVRVFPGSANTNNGWISIGTVAAGLGFLFAGSNTAIQATLEWVAELTVVGANNITWNMGFSSEADSALNLPFANNAAVASCCQFRKKSTDTNWFAVTGQSGGAETSTDCGIAYIPVLNTPQRFRICYDATGTPTITYYINNNLVATHTTNIPAVDLTASFGGTCTGAVTSVLSLGPVKFNCNVM